MASRQLSLAVASTILLALLGVSFDQKASIARENADKASDSPGGRPEDTDMAIHNPHEFAWRLFLALNRQALSGTAGEPDPKKPSIKDYDDDKPVVWETWALSSGGRSGRFYHRPNQSEVFKDRGQRPVAWADLPRNDNSPKRLERLPAKRVEFLIMSGHLRGITQTESGITPMIDPTLLGGDDGEEVRMNRAAFEHVRAENLYSIEGLEEKFTSRLVVSFPQAAQEIKAQWRKIDESVKTRFHWRTLTSKDGNKEYWALTGLHIITRDLPNWFWCDFEHVDWEKFAEMESSDTTTRGPSAPSGKDGVRNETKGTKWEHYRLRGAQVDFTDSRGQATILANTQIEHGFQQTSSCISCHARATAGLRANRPGFPGWQANSLSVFNQRTPVLVGATGSPKPEWFVDEFQQPLYAQTDFIWSLPFRTMSTKEDPPK